MDHVVRARYRLAATAATGLTLVAPTLVEAHHSAAPHYDLDRAVTLSGVVTKFEFVNPHAYIYFDVSAPSSDAGSWRCELQARTALQRLGWTPALVPVGGRIEVVGAPARREAHVCMVTSFSVNGGARVGRNDDVSRLSSSSAPRTVTPRGSAAPVARL